MCGIIGYVGNVNTSDSKVLSAFFKQSLFVDALRGPHSTGILGVPYVYSKKVPKVSIIKKAMNSTDFLQLKSVDDIISKSYSFSSMIGHNRWATMGDIENHTAHPFKYGHITMVHNGTLDSHDYLPKGSSFEVDSEAICHSIFKIGIEKTVKQLKGAFVLVWHDSKDNTVNIIRNSERPFHFAKVKGSDVVLMASEDSLIEYITNRNKISIEEIRYPEPGDLITFDLGSTAVSKYTVKSLEIAPVSLYGAWGDWYETYRTNPKNENTSRAKLFKRYGFYEGEAVELKLGEAQMYKGSTHGFFKVSDTLCDEIDFEIPGLKLEDIAKYKGKTVTGTLSSIYRDSQSADERYVIAVNASSLVIQGVEMQTYAGPGNTRISLDRFNTLTKEGCSSCSQPLYLVDSEHIYWTVGTPAEPICEFCLADDNVYLPEIEGKA